MKFVKLLTSAYVAGVLRHPHEGVLHVEDAEAARLFENEAAEDVTDDFSTKQNAETPVDQITADGDAAEAAAPENPHQAEVAPQNAAEEKPARRKAAASKEN